MVRVGKDIPVGAPNWMDLVTTEPDRAAEFYNRLFGWVANDTPPELGGYRYFEKDGKAVGGVMRNDPEWNMPNAWSIHLRTNDARATEAAAAAHGGKVLMPTMDVMENGSFCVLQDAGGAVISAWQPGTEAGFGVLDEVNTPSHFELHTRDFDKTIQFYKDVFEWNPKAESDTPEFRYWLYATTEEPLAGVMDATAFLPENVPAHWSVYVRVEDAEKCAEEAQKLGGSLLMGPDATPYGTLATLTDPDGAIFKIRA